MTIDHHGSLDEAVFRAINQNCGRLVDAIAVMLSARWFGMVAGVAIVGAIAIVTRHRRLGFLIAFAVALVLSDLVGARALRPLLERMRPCFALPTGTIRWLAPASDVGSLPSLHASNFFAMGFVAWVADRRIGLAALGVAAAVALSRVYVGVHWPTDVAAGAIWGALCAYAAIAVANRAIAQRRRSAPEP
ncbi:MAG TPA: phosphatase PAP2 family protein [Anaeromyxobacter sp.]